MVFLGGLSASVSMIIIFEYYAFVMLSNNVIIPYSWIDTFKKNPENFQYKNIVNIRKVSIFMLIISAFLFYKYLIIKSSLFSVGLVSFVLICCWRLRFWSYLWRRGSYYSAVTGIIAGVIICYVNLIIPQYIQTINPEFSLDNYRILDFL